MSLEIWCRHFTGIQNEKCEAGVEYVSVRHEPPVGMYRWPCTSPDLRTNCPLFAAYTAEEIAEHDRQLEEALSNLFAFEKRETEECIHCGKHVTALRKVGRCIYAEPCGHRLWQGQIPEAWK